MLSCGRVVGQLSRITRHAHPNHLDRTARYLGLNSVRYASDSKSKKPRKTAGTTLKAEECTPAGQYKDVKPKKTTAAPAAAAAAAAAAPPACPVKMEGVCPPQCEDICGPIPPRAPGDKGPGNPFEYWKQLLATLFLAGAGWYTMTQTDLFKPEDSTPAMKSKKKKEKEKLKKREKARIPADSSSIPPEVPYLLIGGGTAAFSAFRSIKSRDPKAKVLVITEETDSPYMRPPLSKELWYSKDRVAAAQLSFRQWNGAQRSLFYEPQEFYAKVDQLANTDKGGVAIAYGWKINKIDPYNKIATLEDGREIKYEKCLIATGATPKNLPVFELADDAIKDKIIAFRTKEDFLELEENVHKPNVKNIVIVGGGFLGSELACSLAKHLEGTNKKVFQVYKEKFVMSQVLPEYLCEWATRQAAAEGVICTPNAEIEDLEMKDGQLKLILTGGKTLAADQIIVAVGAEANTELAGPSNLEVDPQVGGFLVNAELEARSNLWIAGDAACFYDVRLGRRRVEHHDNAVISGRLAGENMTGAGKPYLHQSMFWSDLGPEVGYEAVGIVDSSLPTVGVFAKATGNDTPRAAAAAADESKRSGSEKSSQENNNTAAKSVAETTQEASETRKAAQSETSKDAMTTEAKECQDETATTKKLDDYGKGVIFYLKNDIVVGIVLWNIFNRMATARQVLARGTPYEDLNEVAKLFEIHED